MRFKFYREFNHFLYVCHECCYYCCYLFGNTNKNHIFSYKKYAFFYRRPPKIGFYTLRPSLCYDETPVKPYKCHQMKLKVNSTTFAHFLICQNNQNTHSMQVFCLKKKRFVKISA